VASTLKLATVVAYEQSYMIDHQTTILLHPLPSFPAYAVLQAAYTLSVTVHILMGNSHHTHTLLTLFVYSFTPAPQVMSDPAGGMTFVADPKKPVGGHVMAHASTQRIYMRKGKGEQRVAKVGTEASA
jgi:hypothetical protein